MNELMREFNKAKQTLRELEAKYEQRTKDLERIVFERLKSRRIYNYNTIVSVIEYEKGNDGVLKSLYGKHTFWTNKAVRLAKEIEIARMAHVRPGERARSSPDKRRKLPVSGE